MNSRRTVIVAAGLLLAAVAFIANVVYLQTAQDRAYKNAKLVKVFVIKKPIAKGVEGGQAISQDLVGTGKIPQEFYPGSAIKNVDEIRNKVAISALSPGQILVQGQFVEQSQAHVTFAQQIPQKQTAVSFSVDQIHGVAGLLMPGDKVNMMIVIQGGADSKCGGPFGTPGVRMLYQNVNIIAIGSKTAPQAGESASTTKATTTGGGDTGLITVSVPVEAAERVAFVANGLCGSSFHMSLVPSENVPLASVPSIGGNEFNSMPPTAYPDDQQK